MGMQKLIELVRKIEEAIDEYCGGSQNTDAQRIIQSTIWEIRHRVGMMEESWTGEAGQKLPFNHDGYVSEKLSSLKEGVDNLFSPRKYARAGGVDQVKRQALGDCSRLRTYFGRPWVQAFDWRHPRQGL
jgi:hypothetical protein